MELLFAHLDDPYHVLRLVTAVMDHPSEHYLAASEMAGFGKRLMDEAGRVLLSWRSDEYDQGWHVPGGIIRARETIEHRLKETARLELDGEVVADASPSAILQTRGARGTFISLVFSCKLAMTRATIGSELAEGAHAGQLSWFSELPPMIPVHDVYRELAPVLKLNPQCRLQMRSVDVRKPSSASREGLGSGPISGL